MLIRIYIRATSKEKITVRQFLEALSIHSCFQYFLLLLVFNVSIVVNISISLLYMQTFSYAESLRNLATDHSIIQIRSQFLATSRRRPDVNKKENRETGT